MKGIYLNLMKVINLNPVWLKSLERKMSGRFISLYEKLNKDIVTIIFI